LRFGGDGSTFGSFLITIVVSFFVGVVVIVVGSFFTTGVADEDCPLTTGTFLA